MQIVTDSGADLIFSTEQLANLEYQVVPLTVTLGGKTYREDIDITPEEFYGLLADMDDLPITSQPPAGDFAEVYRQLATKGPEVLSIHISSGLSGTFNSAVAGAKMAPEANVTHFDAKTLSAVVGWMVEAAYKAAKANWPKERILEMLQRISDASDSLYTLNDLKYLIHGGRISHMKGLIASILNIKPLIGVEKVKGTYVQHGQARTFKRALQGLVDLITKQHKPGSELRVQVLHSNNQDGAELLRDLIDKRFKCHWLPLGSMSLVLGAHTGPSMVGVAYAAQQAFSDIP